MPRVVKEENFAAKRKEILDVVRKLVYTKGYEAMSIQDILDEMKISKGAFYHYFDSKQSLLDGLVEKMLEESDQVMSPILEAADLSALEKMKQYFDTGSRWKIDQKPFILNLMRIWYDDSNSLIRHKHEAAFMKHFSPKLAKIIHQGIDEGVFSTRYPEQFADTMLGLSRGLEGNIVGLLLADHPPPDALEKLELVVGSYYESLERILGAPAGSLWTGTMDILREWISPSS